MNSENFSLYSATTKGRLILLSLLISLFSNNVEAQISHGGRPASFRIAQFDDKEIIYSPKVPFNLDKTGDIEKQCTAYEFGKILPLNLNLKNSDFGKRKIDSQGNLIWKASISSKDALALGLYFSDFHIPTGAKLFIYSPKKDQILGSYTELNNSESGLFATELIYGDRLIIEYNEPYAVAGQGHFNIDEVLHAFRGVKVTKSTSGFGGSGSCEVNVNCSEGDTYKNQKNSVVRLLIKDGSQAFWCTGSIVNNTNNDQTPYILTADHCAVDISAGDLNQMIFYFNYESTNCDDPSIEPIARTMTGCTKVSASSNAGILGSDFFLILLNENIPDDINAYFMGWDRTGMLSSNGVTIHHPQGDIKKISTYDNELVSATYTNGGNIGSVGGSWEVFWSETANGHGVTEGGSSGSPLYSQDGYLIGTLTGGYAACSNLTAEDYYGKFSFHWDKNGAAIDTQLKPWLDPNNTGVEVLTGITVGIEENIKKTESFFDAFPNPTHGQLKVQFNDMNRGKIFSLSIHDILGQDILKMSIEAGSQLNLDLQHLKKGIYFLVIEGNQKRETQKISIQ